MKFGPVPVAEAQGATAVHSIRAPGIVLKKGTVVGAAEIAALAAAGIDTIVVARLEEGDVPEDVAAAEIAAAAAGERVRVDRAFTGRCNLFATAPGVLVLDTQAIERLNGIDESVTFATLPAYKPVVEGEMIATVKIIPFAVERGVRDRVLEAAVGKTLLRVAPYRISKVGVVSTVLPGLSDKVIDKTIRVTGERLAPAGATIVAEQRVPHEPEALSRAIGEVLGHGAELVLVFGASAIADRRDVIPSAIAAQGGRIEHFGMPVDPGNLLLVGDLQGRPVLGAPGCARSPKENGFDWVLMRLLAGLPVTRGDIARMGVGGLLMEIVTRPQPRAEPVASEGRSVAAVVLAAGQSRRMGGPNKLLETVGRAPLVRRVVDEVLASKARPVIVVTGHQREHVEEALAGLPVRFVHNPDYAEGLSTSVKAGIAAVPPEADAALISLGDMPQVDTRLVDRLVAAFDPAKGALIVLPTFEGKRGNPVLWSRRFFHDLSELQGDVGARHLIGAYPDAVAEVPADSRAVFFDIDTPDALAAARAAVEAV
jgi:molybdenum cofactor cytidylyltransferase